MIDEERAFEMGGNNPLAWWAYADLLNESALVLKANVAQLGRLMDMRAAVYAMLLGYCIECLLKARWLVRGGRLVVGNRLKRIPRAGDHELLQLADAVVLSLDRRQRDVLDRLSAFVKFAGRYPVPTRPNELRGRVGSDGKMRAPGYFSAEDFDIAEGLKDSLLRGPWPWG